MKSQKIEEIGYDTYKNRGFKSLVVTVIKTIIFKITCTDWLDKYIFIGSCTYFIFVSYVTLLLKELHLLKSYLFVFMVALFRKV